jgi:RNA polymerase sigma-70 factor, ECF subfamily
VSLSEVVRAARRAWPEVAVEDADLLAFLHASPARVAAATTENASELLLAFACARGNDAALRIVDRKYIARLDMLLPERYRADAAEVAQILRERLFVSEEGKQPRIAGYTGRGSLEGWFRVAAVRVALNLRRGRRREVPLDEDRALAERAGGDLEIDDLKRRYRSEFRAAFAAALQAVAPRERTILRQHYLDGLKMEAIGTIHGVHRITVVRWMDRAREALGQETRRELAARIRVDRNELDSILRLIESQLDASFRDFVSEA